MVLSLDGGDDDDDDDGPMKDRADCF